MNNYIKHNLEHHIISYVIVVLILFIIAILYAITISSIEKSRAWEVFKLENNCKVVAYKEGSTSTGLGTLINSNGKAGVGIVTTTTDQTGYICDDGVTYWR